MNALLRRGNNNNSDKNNQSNAAAAGGSGATAGFDANGQPIELEKHFGLENFGNTVSDDIALIPSVIKLLTLLSSFSLW